MSNKVKLYIKSFRVPVVINEEGEAKYQEIELSGKEFHTEERELEKSDDIIDIAKELEEKNLLKLRMASKDHSITTVVKKVLCR